jgi:hypothetical protein
MKSLLLPLGLLAAIGIPYTMSNTGNLKERAMKLWPASSNRGAVAGEGGALDDSTLPNSSIDGAAAVPIEGPVTANMAEILRFDVTSAWVLGRWPRVTTRLGEIHLQGYRVPLVTGTAEDDIAGALTYYFGPDQTVQKIHFTGTTGDARRLVSTVSTQHGLQRKLTEDPNLYLYEVRYDGKPLSQLRIRPARIVSANSPHARFEVALELCRKRGT